MERVTELRVNGARRVVDVDAERTLLSVLRDDLDMTGTKYGCGEGQCGACTVLVDGQATRSCLARVGAVAGRSITTVEGLETQEGLHPVQEAFLAEDALQCGYCTPGMIMSAVALLQRNANPSPAEIARQMEGNICRCGVYPRVVAAVRRAAKSGGGR